MNLKLFSIFGILSVLFFETTLNTQLSLVPVKNSFGIEAVYSQPNYLSGVIASFFELQSYMKIIATSFLGSIVFKFSISLLGKNQFFLLLENFGGLSSNEDLVSLIEKLEIITWDKLIITILFFRFLNKKNLKLNTSTYFVLFLASIVGLGFQFSLNPLTEYHFSSTGYFEDGRWKGWDEVRGLVTSIFLNPLIILILGSSLCYIFNRKNISKSINKYIIYIAIFLMIIQIYSCVS